VEIMVIDKKSPIPIYFQIKEDIKEKINNGIWKNGQYIDSERQICEEYGVSRMTVRQAIGELTREGMLVTEKGKGTFVSTNKITQNNIMSFTDIAHSNNQKPQTNILSFEVVPVPFTYREIITEKEIYEIKRARIINDEIIGIETAYVPCNYLTGATREDLEGSLFNELKKRGYNIIDADATINAVISDENYLKLFQSDVKFPLIQVKSKYYYEKEKIFFLEDALYNSDKFVLHFNLIRKDGILNT
jgi:GntR family transcriptional regulator